MAGTTLGFQFDYASTYETFVPSGDLQLIEGLRAGSEQAYEALIQRFQQPIYSLVARLVDNQDDAVDIVQEVFLKVFRSIPAFRGQSSLKTWIYRIAINEAHNQRRWFFRHRRQEVELEKPADSVRGYQDLVPDPGRSPFEIALGHEQRVLIESALAKLNPRFREVVVLRDIEDLSYEEIAEILNVSLGTVKSRILRGRESLRKLLAGRLLGLPELDLGPQLAQEVTP